jgi:glycine dehydrogenase subunit 1
MNYKGIDDSSKQHLLKTLGIDNERDLFSGLPEELLYPDFNLSKGLDEQSLHRFFSDLVTSNKSSEFVPPHRSFLGGGFYHHSIPSAVNAIGSDGSFATAYTPYQAEASQGTLQALFEYQTYVCELFEMDVVNASHYDGPAALAEAVRMAYFHGLSSPSAKNGEIKNQVIILGALHPEYRQVLETYSGPLSLEFCYITNSSDKSYKTELTTLLSSATCCVVGVTPDFFGRIHDFSGVAQITKAVDALFIVQTDPLYATIFSPPGELDADIAVAEGQPLGIPVQFGGPYLGVFGVKESLIRKMPGRLCGQTKDMDGNRMFTLTLSTREQHIRREKAISNICTNQGLMALRALAYMAVMGNKGLESVAHSCVHGPSRFISLVKDPEKGVPGVEVYDSGIHFRDVRVRLPVDVDPVISKLQQVGIQLGIPLGAFKSEFPDITSKDLLITITEVHQQRDIEYLVESLRGVVNEFLGGKK